MSGPIPLATMRGHRRGDFVERGEGGQHRGGVGQPGMQLERRLGDQGQGALGPDEQLGEVVAGGGLHELAAGADHVAVGEHRLEAEHVVAGHAVLDGPHPPGVGGHVATERRARLSGEHRVDEAVLGEGGVELFEGHAGLDHRHVIVEIDLEDGVHALERHQDPVGR